MSQKYYSMKIAGLDRNLPLCPLNDKLMIISHSKKNPDTEVPDSNTPSEPAS